VIDHIIFDVDGTLTDGGIIISDNGIEAKQFQAKDGLIIRMLPKLGFTTIIITGRKSELTAVRADDLNISLLMQGVHDKEAALKDYFSEHNLSGERFAFIGDDLNDYAAMQLCSFKFCPADAAKEIREICDYVSIKKGGCGAVRDICEYLLRKQNQYSDLLMLLGLQAACLKMD
jgi:3-deoxy-D-manno-octulosonate 8-phosphate phosphatase (KDO 8-P phosphatase)